MPPPLPPRLGKEKEELVVVVVVVVLLVVCALCMCGVGGCGLEVKSNQQKKKCRLLMHAGDDDAFSTFPLPLNTHYTQP